ncbi:MAG: hypothetical protein WC838_02965 [Candidatus Margulisiibacteriota bacterium]|jgi:hypothetical protein
MKKVLLASALVVVLVSSVFAMSVGTVGTSVVAGFDLGSNLQAQVGGYFNNNSVGTEICALGKIDYALMTKGALSAGVTGAFQMVTARVSGGSSSTGISGGLFLQADLTEKVSIQTTIPVITITSVGGASATTTSLEGGSLSVMYQM